MFGSSELWGGDLLVWSVSKTVLRGSRAYTLGMSLRVRLVLSRVRFTVFTSSVEAYPLPN